MKIEQIIIEGKIWYLPKKLGIKLIGLPVNGEIEFNQPGLSHGFIHFKDPETGKCQGFCGINYFIKHAICNRRLAA